MERCVMNEKYEFDSLRLRFAIINKKENNKQIIFVVGMLEAVRVECRRYDMKI